MSFEYKSNQLFAERLSVSDIAKKHGTPAYIYSKKQFEDNYTEFKNAFDGLDVTTCYALKANNNIHITKLFADLGAGADTVSEGDIRAALMAGIATEKIVFSGVGKTKREMEYALNQKIGQFNVESIAEIEVLNEVAGKLQVKAPVSIRVNPDVDAITHKKITTGRKQDKFGIAWEDVFYVYDNAKKFENIDIQGITTHIGSQITNIEPYAQAFKKIAELCTVLKDRGFNISRIDLGGGIGVQYNDEKIIDIKDYAKLVQEIIAPLGVKIFLEPGRRLTANAGILISEVQYIKQNSEKNFAIIDAGMNDLARPAIYGSYHNIIAVEQRATDEKLMYDIVGPVCESSDIFGRERRLQSLKSGDLLAITYAGAYGSSMNSMYNLRPLIPEILVSGEELKIIRERQTYDEMFKAFGG